MDKLINLFKILSDENRMRILFMLKEKQLCVCEMLSLLNITGATLSSHLKILKLSGIIEQKKSGRWIEYTLSDKITIEMLDFIEKHFNDKKKISEDRAKLTKVKRENICNSKR